MSEQEQGKEAASVPPDGAGAESEAERQGERIKSLIRRAAFRSALFGLGLTIGEAVCFGIMCVLEGPPPAAGIELLYIALVMLVLGLVTGTATAPMVLVELRAARHAPSLPRHLYAGALAGVLALGAFFIVALQLVYASGVIQSRSVEAGLRQVQTFLSNVQERPWALNFFVAGAAPFAPLTFTRLRGRGLAGQVGWTLLVGAALATPSYVVIASEVRVTEGAVVILVFYAIAYACLPLGARLADRLEARASAYFARRRAALQ